jgi:predicted small lipoprotein YifL
MTRRRLLALLGAAVLGAPLAACGRKGRVIDPDDPVYPRVYPYTPRPASTKAETARPRTPTPDDETDTAR